MTWRIKGWPSFGRNIKKRKVEINRHGHSSLSGCTIQNRRETCHNQQEMGKDQNVGMRENGIFKLQKVVLQEYGDVNRRITSSTYVP